MNLLTLFAVGCITFMAWLTYLFGAIRFEKRCPTCGNPHPDRIARSGLMKLFTSKAYHCAACGKRFYQLEKIGAPSRQHR
ncbi:hypothetical protein GO755_31360 [Spirosoma sp. HMF4905]|uniref:C2H2-type domain-containing protein n=1 Tax=Spirosoma arboris TaxID=2682092 RepID=A0A7K1SL81_9BACT|nr:hypothetical protein [Spirosoma arboris]MVM34569.1 hypothetical protein [Spirosoma arboris]